MLDITGFHCSKKRFAFMLQGKNGEDFVECWFNFKIVIIVMVV